MALKGKALRRAMETKDSVRLIADIPLIQDSTELITVERAQELLKKISVIGRSTGTKSVSFPRIC